ncbi:MAG TPA: rod shape-determining protein MreD [Phycisphaerae bacterium]|nr:rod shape-determining protein MreD [Phycisphaerae bacterium]
MRWITFLILLYLATALQSSHLGQLNEAGFFHIEYLPALAVFYALLADRWSALLVCFICGAVYDLTGDSLLGLQAILMFVVGYAIVGIRAHVFRNNMISQGVITFLTVLFLLAARAMLTHIIFWFAGRHQTDIAALTQTGIIFSSALYTALVAPLLFKAMLLIGSLLGFENPHHRTPRERDRLM